ncbi:UNVERIFIED_CONTAM: hypothetical protein Sangu_1563100 [Sesamum angustifolium]|uniref:Uncharacterized protein n=1 Tax=Sesamum angustifolium TaxID=2727405 RepID=A0AAW2MRR6_9LAMI
MPDQKAEKQQQQPDFGGRLPLMGAIGSTKGLGAFIITTPMSRKEGSSSEGGYP